MAAAAEAPSANAARLGLMYLGTSRSGRFDLEKEGGDLVHRLVRNTGQSYFAEPYSPRARPDRVHMRSAMRPQLVLAPHGHTELPDIVRRFVAGSTRQVRLGVWPEIGRAWAIVDTRLVVWRYDTGDDVIVLPDECEAEDDGTVTRFDQRVMCAGLVVPRPNTFPGRIRVRGCAARRRRARPPPRAPCAALPPLHARAWCVSAAGATRG